MSAGNRISAARQHWRRGEHAAAELILREAAEDQLTGPEALNTLGLLLLDQGDRLGALAAYRRALAAGHPLHRQRAALALGVLLAGQREYREARTMLGIACGGPDPETSGQAKLKLDAIARLGD